MSNYEPMTGENMPEEPVMGTPTTEETMPEEPVNPYVPETEMEGYGSMMGAPMENGNIVVSSMANGGKKKTPIIIGAVASVVAVAALVAILFLTGVFSSPQTKIITAFANTFKETSEMTKAFSGFYVMWGDSYTVGMEIDAEGQYMDFQYAVKGKDKQLSGNISLDDTPEIEFLAGIDESLVKAKLPDLSDYVFTYNYREEKNGYLVQEAGEETITAIDALCEMLYEQKDQNSSNEEMKKVYEELFKGWEVESVDKAEFEVNGETVNCKGYRTVITQDKVMALIDATEERLNPEYVEALEKMDMDVSEVYDDMREDVEDMEEVEVLFYLYKNKIACIRFGGDEGEAEVLFKGCEKGMYDVELCADGETILKIDGSVDGDIERYVVEAEGEQVISMEYDVQTDSYEFVGGGAFTMSGILESDSEGANITIDEVEIYGESMDVSFSMTAQKGADLQEFDGEEIDLGNASEDELTTVAMDFISAMDY